MCTIKESPGETAKSLSGMENQYIKPLKSLPGPETGDQDSAFTFKVLTGQWRRYLPKQVVSIQFFNIITDFISKAKWESNCWTLKTYESKDPAYFCFLLCRATPMIYGSSQARGQIGTAAASLHHSHSNMGAEPSLQIILQLMSTPDP